MVSPSGRIYIGQTRDLYQRFKDYRNHRCKRQRRLFYSISKYGFDAHDFHVIDFCPVEELNNRERHYQDVFDVCGEKGLNLILTKSNTKTHYRSKETLNLMSIAGMGKHNHDERVRGLISKAHKGKSIPQWHREHNSKVLKVKFIGDGNPFYGKTHSEEYKKVMSKRSSGGNNPKAKTFLNIDTGIYYETLTELAKHIGISNPTVITRMKLGMYSSYICV